MFPSCLNLSNAHEISLCQDDDGVGNETLFDVLPLDENVEKIISRVVFILFGLIFFVGLIGNLLVVIVVLFNPNMRSTTNYLIICLAISDLLFVIMCIPFTARYSLFLKHFKLYLINLILPLTRACLHI